MALYLALGTLLAFTFIRYELKNEDVKFYSYVGLLLGILIVLVYLTVK